MKLFYSQNSPYSRIARIALRECGLLGEVSELQSVNRAPDNPVLQYSPAGRVPTLVDGELVITEARHVFEYLVQKTATNSLELAKEKDWLGVQQEGQILGLLDGVAFWVRELRRKPEYRSSFLIGVEQDRLSRCLAYLESNASREQLPGFTTFRGMALIAALDLMKLHGFKHGWQSNHPLLSAWFDDNSRQESVIQTAPVPVN